MDFTGISDYMPFPPCAFDAPPEPQPVPPFGVFIPRHVVYRELYIESGGWKVDQPDNLDTQDIKAKHDMTTLPYLTSTFVRPEDHIKKILGTRYNLVLNVVPVSKELGPCREQAMWTKETSLSDAWSAIRAQYKTHLVALHAVPKGDRDIFIDLDIDLMGDKYLNCKKSHPNGEPLCPTCWCQFLVAVGCFLETYIKNLEFLCTSRGLYNNLKGMAPPSLSDFMVCFSGNRGVHIWAHPKLGLACMNSSQRLSMIKKASSEWATSCLSSPDSVIKGALFAQVKQKHGLADDAATQAFLKQQLAANANLKPGDPAAFNPGEYIWILDRQDISCCVGTPGAVTLETAGVVRAVPPPPGLGINHPTSPVVHLPVDIQASAAANDYHRMRVPFSPHLSSVYAVTPFDFAKEAERMKKGVPIGEPKAFAINWTLAGSGSYQKQTLHQATEVCKAWLRRRSNEPGAPWMEDPSPTELYAAMQNAKSSAGALAFENGRRTPVGAGSMAK